VPNKKAKLPLSKTHPKLAKEADGWDPSSITAGSGKKVKWKCKLGHSYEAIVASRAGQNSGCAVCTGNKVLIGFNDLRTTHPDLAKEVIDFDPEAFTFGSGKKLKWKCPKGHIYESTIVNRTSRKSGCPICSNNKVLPGFNDLATIFPELAKEAYGWDPSTYKPMSGKKVTWKCIKGHIFSSIIANRSKGVGCGVCANKVIIAGINDLATLHPKIAAQANGWDPRKVIPGSHKKLLWRCPVGHSYLANISDRTGGKQSACPICANKQILVGFNDLKSKYPEIASQAYGWDPTTVTSGSSKKLMWKCSENHLWKTIVSDRTGVHKSGCPSCAKGGFDPNKDGYLYFITHPDWEMFQIGITNAPDDRLKDHKKLGWVALENRGPMDGHLTQQWETAILRMLKAKGADLSNSKIAGKFDGYSEAWSKSTFPVKSIKELMKLTEEFEEDK
jgi:plastocyanin